MINSGAMCIVMCMRTNIEIDKNLMEEARSLAGAKTMRETVDLALKQLVDRHKRMGVLELAGKVKWEGDLAEMRRNFLRDHH